MVATTFTQKKQYAAIPGRCKNLGGVEGECGMPPGLHKFNRGRVCLPCLTARCSDPKEYFFHIKCPSGCFLEFGWIEDATCNLCAARLDPMNKFLSCGDSRGEVGELTQQKFSKLIKRFYPTPRPTTLPLGRGAGGIRGALYILTAVCKKFKSDTIP
jgi:hypothetical protein